MKDNLRIKEWFFKNFKTHTDWTGEYIEYKRTGSTIEEMINNFFAYINEKY